MSIKGTPEGNFFEDNRDLRYVPQFADLIREHGEILAGKYVWAIWLVHSPRSDLFDMAMEDKIEWVKEEYLEDPGFKWPQEREYVGLPEPPKKKGGRKAKDDDDFEIYEILKKAALAAGNVNFYECILVFPKVAMEAEERDYYDLRTLHEESIRDAKLLGPKDKSAAVRQIAASSDQLDKMKAKYLSYRESAVRSSGETQSGGISKMKGR